MCGKMKKKEKIIIFNIIFVPGSDIAFYLHLVFSFLDVMYIPYAIIYYVDR